jgi:hypothetical protein
MDWPPPIFDGIPIDPVPPVDPADLKAAWRVHRELAGKVGPDGRIWLGSRPFVEACSPGANALAASYRCMILILVHGVTDDAVAPWKRNGELDEAVFKVAARLPMEWMLAWTAQDSERNHYPFDMYALVNGLLHERTGL